MIETLVVILVNLVVLFGFFILFRRRIDRALQTDYILRDIRAEVDQMIVELNETTDRNIRLVEEQLARLSTRITEADHRIVVLKKEDEKAHSVDSVYTKLRPAAAARKPKGLENKTTQVSEKKKSTREQVLELYRSGMEAREIATRLGKNLGEVELIITLGANRA
jgi:DNA-binding NarL/FixJ family response regulator